MSKKASTSGPASSPASPQQSTPAGMTEVISNGFWLRSTEYPAGKTAVLTIRDAAELIAAGLARPASTESTPAPLGASTEDQQP